MCDDAVVRKRVLIVDDHEPFRAVARELLERAGYIVTGEAGDAAEALAAIAAEAPDVVLLDVQLPIRTASPLRPRSPPSQGPAVVLISSRDADAYGRRVAFVWSSRLHPEVEAVRRHLRRAARVMASVRAAATRPTRVVCATRCSSRPRRGSRPRRRCAGCSRARLRTRIATDMAVAWALAAAALVIAGTAARGGERRGCSPPLRSPFWAPTSSGRARTRCGRSDLILEQLWIALLAVLLLALPEGRPQFARHALGDRRRLRGDARRAGRRGSWSTRTRATCSRLRLTRASPTRSTERRSSPESRSRSSSCSLLLRRLRELRGAARRSQGPLLAAAAVDAWSASVWLGL